MNTITRRIGTVVTVLAAPVIISMGAATAAQAAAANAAPGPSTTQIVDAKYNRAAPAVVTGVSHRHHGYYHRR